MVEKVAIKNNIIIPGVGGDPRAHELREVLKICSDKKIRIVVEEERKVEEREKREEERKKKERKEKKLKLMGNTDAILDDLKENYIKIEEDKEIMGYEGKIVHIDLPAIGDFEGFKFDYFVSYKSVAQEDFEKKFELKKKSYSVEDVSELLQAMNSYMKELQGKNDGDMDYENKLRYLRTNTRRCNVGDCLKYITGLDRLYWLRDMDVAGDTDMCAGWTCHDDNCHFVLYYSTYHAYLFLRLSD